MHILITLDDATTHYVSVDTPTRYPVSMSIASPVALVTLYADQSCTFRPKSGFDIGGTWRQAFPPPITTRQAPELVAAHDTISERLGRITRNEAWDRQVCATCGKSVKPADFTNKIAINEYSITAECEPCQDSTWASFAEE